MGGSAGGHLAAMLAVAESKEFDPAGPYPEFSCRVQCPVPMYGAYDFIDLTDLTMIRKPRAQAPEPYARVTDPLPHSKDAAHAALVWDSGARQRPSHNRDAS